MTFRIIKLTKQGHLQSILSIEIIWKLLEFDQINKLISGKLQYTQIKTKSNDPFFGYYTDV